MKRKPDHPQPSRQRRRAIGSRGRAGAKGTDMVPSAPSPSDTAQGPTPPRTRQLAMPQHSLSLLKFLNEDRIRQRFCDVSVSVGGKVYSAHKVVLAHGSSYFHAELSKNPDNGRVTLDHVDESVFQHLLGFLYTSECVVAEMELPALTEAARFLDMMEVLKLLCEEAGVRPATAIKKSGPPEVAVETETRGTKVRDPPSTMCSLSGLRFCTAKSRENRLAESDSGLQQAEPDKTVELSAERTAATRRSARRRRAPAKYERHQTEHSEGKQITLSPGEQDEYEGEEEPKGEVVKKQNPKLGASETSEPAQEEADEGREENEDGMSDKRPALPVREPGDGESPEGSDGEANRQQIVPETEANTPKGEGSNQAPPIYPEGLAPVILHTSSKKMLKCPKCDKTFDRTGKYESHTRVHTGEKPFQCDICLQRYSTKSNLTVHKKKHGADTAFQEKEHRCPFCNKLHASKKTLAKHVRRFHPDDIQEFLTMKKKKSEGWKCAVCLKVFTRRPHLEEHMILHTQDRPFKCTFCDEHFRSRFARLKHQEKYHLGPFPCGICGRQFNDTGNRKRHMECTHGGKRKWTCPVCGKSVRERTTLREHLRIHSGEKPHLCSICGQNFRHGSSYRLHLRVHHDDKRYECDECGKTFIRHDHLTKHQKIHSGEKAHQCEQCGKCFRRPDHLTVHYKTVHLGEKVRQKYKTAMHECGVCKKEFKGKSSLEMHFRTHSGEKPYRCPECDQTFRIKKTLTKHMVIHSDARPFNCPHCCATFKRKDKLKCHMDHVHSAKFAEQPVCVLGQNKIVSLPYQETSKMYQVEAKSALQGAAAPAQVCASLTLVPVQMAGVSAGQGDMSGPETPLSSQPHVLAMQAQGQQQAPYQATADLAFLDKYTLTPQPANMAHPMRPSQMLDPRQQSYLGTLLGLDSAPSGQNIPSADHTH